MNRQMSKYKIIFSLLVLLLPQVASSQSVGIGTISPDPVSILDVTVPDTTGNPQGLLLPRLWSANRATLTLSLNASHAGLIVYDLDSNCVTIWKGTSWDGCAKDGISSNSWSTTGNGISAGEFIGTTNAQDLAFRSNNIEVGRLTQSSGVRFGSGVSGTGIASIAIGSNVVTNGNRAVGIGNYVNAAHLGSFVIGDWSGSSPATTSSTLSDQFTARFQSGYRFFTDATLTANQGIYFVAGGDVGIGNTAPAEKLDVEGSIQVDGDYTYESVKTYHYVMTPADFVPTFNTAGRYADGTSTGNAKWMEGGTAGVSGYFYGGIHLPDGATITNIELFYSDNDASQEISALVRRYDLTANNLTTIGSGSSGVANSGGLGSFNMAMTHVVDNARYGYYIAIETDQNNSNLWLRGAQVKYTVTKAE